MIIDKLFDSVDKNGYVCLGLDTALEYIPKHFFKDYEKVEDLLFNFNKRIIDATYDVVACYKVQIAYYEAYGLEGLKAYMRTLRYLKNLGCITIADIKRGDIAKTADMYAKAHFEGDFESDFITLSPYMGMDSIEPYLSYVENREKGLFVLIRTSNKGAEDIQYIDTQSGEKIYNTVGNKVSAIGQNYIGKCGYSSIGGVMGCTHSEEGAALREALKNVFFLIPGYGAQGGKAEDVALYMRNGNGGVVNSSRGILLAYKKVENGEKQFELCARNEAIRMNDEIKNAVSRIK